VPATYLFDGTSAAEARLRNRFVGMSPDDERLSRERSRFESLYRDNVDVVLAYALSRADVDTAKDVAADTFLVAWRRLDSVPDPARPWLLGVARKVLADHRRAAHRREALVAKVSGVRQPGVVEPCEVLVSRSEVLGAVQRLSAEDQEVLRLVAWDGLSYADAARVLGCSRAGFAVRLHRARRRFEAALANGEGMPDPGAVPATQRPSVPAGRRVGELVEAERAEGCDGRTSGEVSRG